MEKAILGARIPASHMSWAFSTFEYASNDAEAEGLRQLIAMGKAEKQGAQKTVKAIEKHIRTSALNLGQTVFSAGYALAVLHSCDSDKITAYEELCAEMQESGIFGDDAKIDLRAFFNAAADTFAQERNMMAEQDWNNQEMAGHIARIEAEAERRIAEVEEAYSDIDDRAEAENYERLKRFEAEMSPFPEPAAEPTQP
jgi:hypothetical protein